MRDAQKIGRVLGQLGSWQTFTDGFQTALLGAGVNAEAVELVRICPRSGHFNRPLALQFVAHLPGPENANETTLHWSDDGEWNRH